MADCEYCEVSVSDSFRNGQYAEKCDYTCNVTGEECTLWYDGYCNNEEE